MPAPFLIYNASAGAGKTYNLVRHYLKLSLQSRDSLAFMHILAITFTNKAANEMKDRLIKQLQILSDYPTEAKQEVFYTEELAREMSLEPQELKYRAADSLASILHNYSAFSVSTIDRFTNRLIRNFSRDLKLNSNYQVEMQTELILQEAVDRTLDELQEDSAFAQILSSFIKAQLEDEKSPDARRILLDLGQELFRERSIEPLEALKQIEPEEYLQIEKDLRARQQVILKGHQKKAQALEQFCQEQGIETKSFADRFIRNHISKMAQGNFMSFGKKALQYLAETPEQLVHAKNPEASALEPHQAKVFQAMSDLQNYFWETIEEEQLLAQILGRLSAMAVLAEIELQLEEVKAESNRLPIGEFNKIISRELRQQPAPFIYERIGERYQHFFIDEFQDTSILQWHNLLPLINNSLAAEGSSALIVGDAKQSIYRFRGGELQLFVDLVTNQDDSNKMEGRELYSRETKTLGKNYRSLREIVHFNNAFFTMASEFLNEQEHQQLYQAGVQEPAGAEGGYVAFHQLERDKYAEAQEEKLIEIINDAFSRGYQQKDLCILVRSNDDGKAAAEYLLQSQDQLNCPQNKALQILSVDSLVVGASASVRALVSFLKMMEQPENLELRKEWLEYAYLHFAKRQEERHQFLARHRDFSLEEELAFLEQESLHFESKDWRSQDLIQQLYGLAKALKMPWQSDPYLQFFFDQAQDYLKNHRPISQEFLEWWEEHGYQKSVSLPQSMDAIQIMSIHKSKGLEFPVVICLKVEKKLDDKLSLGKGWLDLSLTGKEDFAGLPFALLSFKTPRDEAHQPIFAHFREQERAKVMLDNLNARYVAFTRAERELHILSPSPIKNPSDHLEFLLSQFFEANGPGTYTRGQKTQATQEEKADDQYRGEPFEALDWSAKIEAISSAPLNWQSKEGNESRWGKKVHQILAHLERGSDLASVIRRAERQAWFEKEELDRLAKQMAQLVRLPALKPLFEEEIRVFNERSLLVPNVGQRIPDRLVEYQGHWYLADYKSGAPRPAHKAQVEEYRQHLKEAGFSVQKCYLIYLKGEEVAVESW